MDLVESTTDPARSAAHDLRGTIRGSILLPTDAAYERARLVWNGAVTHRPALIVQCETSGDVQAAVLAARARGLPLSVRGGGHDWAGRSLRHDGLVAVTGNCGTVGMAGLTRGGGLRSVKLAIRSEAWRDCVPATRCCSPSRPCFE
jgi:FAD binding domain